MIWRKVFFFLFTETYSDSDLIAIFFKDSIYNGSFRLFLSTRQGAKFENKQQLRYATELFAYYR